MKLNWDSECADRANVFGAIRRGRCSGLGYGIKVFFAAVFCGFCIQAGAAISSVTVSVPQQEDFSDVPVTFQEFDPGLGKLASVEIILQGTGQMTQEFENLSHRSNSALVRQTLLLSLTMANANSPLVSASQTERHKYEAGPFDGAIDFGGASGDTGVYNVTASNQILLQSRKSLAMFTGSDMVKMFLSSDSSFHISSGKNAMFGVDAMAGADITIIYNYTSIPEPAWFGGLAGALALMCAVRFQARNHSA